MEAVIFENIWKFVFILALMSSGYFFNKYTARIEKTLEKLTDGVNRLTTLGERHEERFENHRERLDNHQARIEDVENAKIVKYRK
jgi:hypothetical protein